MILPPAEPLRFTDYTPDHDAFVHDMIGHCDPRHAQLDWFDDARLWLAEPGVSGVLGWQAGRPVALLAASPPVQGTCWLRLLYVCTLLSAGPVFRQLWAMLTPRLRAAGVERVYVMAPRPWLARMLAEAGFTYEEDVVTLRRRLGARGRSPSVSATVQVRRADLADLAALVAVDQAAFPPEWWLRERVLRRAVLQAASVHVALLDEQMVGYELTLQYHNIAHLTRLATLPEMQRQGVATALVSTLLVDAHQRGADTITVNTQRSNLASQNLYRRFGFDFTGNDLPVWVAWLKEIR